ncbi:MAG: WYL domain-containing protein [Chlorobium sp.]|nr:WYL domain-containing protein [Chlorobium sp.]
MTQIDRVYALLEIFHNRNYAIRTDVLANLLGCSIPTVKRYISKLRNEYGVPLCYDFKYQGYVLDKSNDASIQFPGLWFNVSELHSLLTIHELINKLDPGFLKAELSPLRIRIEKILAGRGVKTGELIRRIHFIGVGVRVCCPLAFRITATAAMERKRLKLRYHGRGEDRVSTRQVSPQRLIYYRGNWYLAAYCHTRKALRTLALDRMSEVVPVDACCEEIPEEAMEIHFTESFGIFAGRPQKEAVLCFSKESARWVAEEKWHPNQRGQWLADGSFELCLPYADQRELVMEILRYGPDVRVVAPPELQQAVHERLTLALQQYEKKMKNNWPRIKF